MTIVRTDRSRIELFQRCPRARWWANHWGGRGVQSTRLSLPLLTGSATHEGLGWLHGALILGADPSAALEASIAHARGWYEEQVRAAEIDLEQSEDQFYVAQEQMALTEGLLRCFAKTTLPRLLEEFEILEVEREEDELLATLNPFGDSHDELRLMGRVDALVRERSSGDLHLWSFKTASTWDKRKDKSAEHDQQGLSEAWLVEQRLGRWRQDIDEELAMGLKMPVGADGQHPPESAAGRAMWADPSMSPKIMGVQMIHLLKGRRAEHPKGSGRWITFSPLIRGYRRHGTVGTEYAHSWEWDDAEGSHRLGGKWERFDVWSDYAGGIKQWIDDLDALLIQPQSPSPLEAQILTPMPYFRQPEDMQNWLEQTRAQELRIAENLANMAARPDGYGHEQAQLNAWFPQHRHSCHYPGDCQFLRLCFGSADYARDPIAIGDYKWREFNHPQEATNG